MEIFFETEILKAFCDIGHKILIKGTNLPVLKSVAMGYDKDKNKILRLTNLGTTVTVGSREDIVEGFYIEFSMLRSAMKNFTGFVCTFNQEDDFVYVSGQTTKLPFIALPEYAFNYKHTNRVSEIELEIDPQEFKKALVPALLTACFDEDEVEFSKLHFDATDKKLVSSDRHRLTCAPFSYDDKRNFHIPRRDAQALAHKKVLFSKIILGSTHSQNPVEYAHFLSVYLGHKIIVTFDTPETQYVDYNLITSKRTNRRVDNISSKLFKVALDKIKPFTVKQKSNNARYISLTVSNDVIEISVKSEDIGESSVKIPCTFFDSEKFTMRFNLLYLLDVIKSFNKNETISLSFESEGGKIKSSTISVWEGSESEHKVIVGTIN